MSLKELLFRKISVFSLAIVMSMPTLAEITVNENTKLTKPEVTRTYTAARAIALQKVKEGVKYSNRSIRGSYYAQ